MIRRLWSFFQTEVRGIHDAAYMLGGFAVLSALLAIVRDRLFASTFGAGELLDVYFSAFRIPDILFVTIASVVSVFALVPFLEEKNSEESSQRFFGNVVLVFSCALSLSAFLIFLFIPNITRVVFPALSAGAYGEMLVHISRILLLQPILLGLSAILTAVVQIKGRYLLFALAPLLYNLSIIVGIMVCYPLWGVSGIAWAVVLGAFLHVSIQMPFVTRAGFMQFVFSSIDWTQLARLVRASLPRTIALASTNILLFIITIIAATYPEGSVSIFTLAFNLQSAPLAIIGASYSVAAFPTLARHFARGESQEFVHHILTAARHIIFWSLPFLALFVVLRAHIVRVVLGAGAFDWTDTRLVAAAVALFMVSLVAQGLSLLFIRGYYAAGKTVFPLIVTIASSVFTVFLALNMGQWFMQFELLRNTLEILLRVEDVSGTVVLMLPLSFAVGALVQASIFVAFFEYHFASVRASLSRVAFEVFGASVVAAFCAHETLALFAPVVLLERALGVFAQGFIAGFIGIIAGVFTLFLLGNQELKEVFSAFHKMFWHQKVTSVVEGA